MFPGRFDLWWPLVSIVSANFGVVWKDIIHVYFSLGMIDVVWLCVILIAWEVLAW